jgi:hypothetical protein
MDVSHLRVMAYGNTPNDMPMPILLATYVVALITHNFSHNERYFQKSV